MRSLELAASKSRQQRQTTHSQQQQQQQHQQQQQQMAGIGTKMPLSHHQQLLGTTTAAAAAANSTPSRESSIGPKGGGGGGGGGSSTVSASSSSRAASLSPQVDMAELRCRLTEGCVRFSAHYLGAAEISNVEGTEDCRRAMNVAKGKAGQLSEVPHVLLEIAVSGVNILDENERAICHQPISHIQVVCQDELDLNCFAYIFKDGDRHFSHVFCVLTAMIAKEIIVTLGEAFNLAYKLALERHAEDI